jgi:1-aminocyclopropane-1-carboxylate deaminase/D-cysteine desulfhydrase-like pyridoxal-dependent ACC family enzyme
MLPALSFDSITVDSVSSFYAGNIEADVLRLDRISPVVSGNKWFKLRFYLEEAIALGKKGIITFGGAWSNHIVATAAACNMSGLASIGIIRGEEPRRLSPTLVQAREWGMQLYFIPRDSYQQKEIPALPGAGDYVLVNEGGYGATGARGAATILDYVNKEYTHYCCAAGTGTMMAGLINTLLPGRQVTGISVLKNNADLNGMIQALAGDRTNWQLHHAYSFGGYAKHQPALLEFMNTFYSQTGIPSDFVYTGKLFFAISDLVMNHYFPANSRLLILHSGGLQGNASLPPGTLLF